MALALPFFLFFWKVYPDQERDIICTRVTETIDCTPLLTLRDEATKAITGRPVILSGAYWVHFTAPVSAQPKQDQVEQTEENKYALGSFCEPRSYVEEKGSERK